MVIVHSIKNLYCARIAAAEVFKFEGSLGALHQCFFQQKLRLDSYETAFSVLELLLKVAADVLNTSAKSLSVCGWLVGHLMLQMDDVHSSAPTASVSSGKYFGLWKTSASNNSMTTLTSAINSNPSTPSGNTIGAPSASFV